MVTLLERSISSIERRMVLLAPPQSPLPAEFKRVSADPRRHQQLVRQMQRLRGNIYLNDGALQADQLTGDGLHRTVEDERSWHLLMLDERRQVSACIWYMEHDHPTSIQDLRVRSCPLSQHDRWRDKVRSVVESDLRRARAESVRYAEVGGWAVADQRRCTPEGLLLILATFGLSRIFGGALGISTATARHSSASILRRLGLLRLEADGAVVPPYYDSKYDCEMELLRFDTRRSSPKYHGLIEVLKQRLGNVPVVATEHQVRENQRALESTMLPITVGASPMPVWAA